MAKTMKLLCVLVIIAMVVVVGIADMMVPEPVPEPEPQPDCEVTCRNDDDCEAISDDSYCDQIGACGTNENGEPLGYCYAIDACAEWPHCTVVADCPADGNTYVDCCEFGICPDGLGYCC